MTPAFPRIFSFLVVPRPAWRGIVVAFCQLMRRFIARDRHRPNRSVITLLFLVDRHPHKRNARALRRNLWIADPDKIEQILFRDGAFLGEKGTDTESEKNDEAQMTNDEGMRKHES